MIHVLCSVDTYSVKLSEHVCWCQTFRKESLGVLSSACESHCCSVHSSALLFPEFVVTLKAALHVPVSPSGTRDRRGRALLTVCSTSSVWSNPDCDTAELLRLLLYYTSTLRYTPPPAPQLCVRLAYRCSPSDIISCVWQGGSEIIGTHSAVGRPQSCSCPHLTLRPPVSAGGFMFPQSQNLCCC